MLLMDGLEILDRTVSAVDKVRERLLRATAALGDAGVVYAVAGGNAVAVWVEDFGEGGERNTPNVDLLIDRADSTLASAALQSIGFFATPDSPDLFLDGPSGSLRTRLRLIFAGERVNETDLLPNPGVEEVVQLNGFAVLSLPALVQTKLVAYRIIDRVHLRDLLGIGLIDASWKDRSPPELAERLQVLADDPNG